MGWRLRGLYCWLAYLFVCAAMASVANAASSVEATIPVEVLELDPELATGELYGQGLRLNGFPTVGHQRARVFRGIIPETAPETARSSSPLERVLAFALLGGIQRDANAAARSWNVPSSFQAWCSLKANRDAVVRCYQDLDADGRLEVERDGYVFGDGLALITVGPSRRIEPIGYRAAPVEELPLMLLGYDSCNIPNEFAVDLRWLIDGKAKQAGFAGCRILSKAVDSSSSMLQVDRFKLAVTETDGRPKTRIVEGIAAGTLLGNVRVDRPLTNLTDTPGPLDRLKQQVGTKPFVYFTDLPVIAADEVPKGGEIVAGSVEHGIKGRLEAPIISKRYGRTSEVVAAASSVYGIPMSYQGRTRSSEVDIVWCWPHLDQKRQQWTTDCFSKGIGGTQIAKVRGTPFAIESLVTSQYDQYTSLPIVERGAGDLGPLRISVRLERWRRDDVLLAVSIEPQSGSVNAWEYRFKRRDDGSVVLRFGEGEVRLTPSNSVRNGAAVEVIAPLTQGDSALPRGMGGPKT